MRKILLVFIILFVHSFSFSQDLNKIGAAGISFLLNSQSGQQNLNQDEKVALSILGSFLNEQSNRQHDLNVANATSTKVIQSTNGSSIQLMKDLEGNVYLVQDGIVHKISSSVVSLAANTVETIESKRYLPNYNLSELKTKCEHLPSDNSKYEDRKVETKHINYSISTKTILEQYPSATSIRKTGTKEYYYDSRGIRISQIPTNTQINIAYLPNYDKKLTELKTTFTCKWYDWNTSLATQMDD
ncbi:MAG: hypothetical protein KAQ75_13725, partial [Bacteroidales bacterium]|nr:hypothetical protein [Bacteroidales bacterium]